MRKAPICPLPDFFVAHLDRKKQYVEINFEERADALRYIARLKKNRVIAELFTRVRVFPEAK